MSTRMAMHPALRHAYACAIHGRTDERTYADACISERRVFTFETRGRAYGNFADRRAGGHDHDRA